MFTKALVAKRQPHLKTLFDCAAWDFSFPPRPAWAVKSVFFFFFSFLEEALFGVAMEPIFSGCSPAFFFFWGGGQKVLAEVLLGPLQRADPVGAPGLPGHGDGERVIQAGGISRLVSRLFPFERQPKREPTSVRNSHMIHADFSWLDYLPKWLVNW